MSASFDERAVGLFVMRYGDVSELLPEHQTALVDELVASSAARPTGVAFVLADGITWVDPSVPKFWLEVTGRVRLAGMAIVTASAGVRVAASGFRLANVVRGVKLQVATFDGEEAAVAWLASRLGSGTA